MSGCAPGSHAEPVAMAAFANETLSTLIGSIYDCVLDPSRWEATLAEIAGLLHSEKAILSLNDLRQDCILIKKTVGWDPHWLERRDEYLPEIHDALRQWFMRDPSLDDPFIASREIPASEFDSIPYVRDCLRPQGICDVAHFFLISTPAHFSELVLFWPQRYGVVTDREIELGSLLLPHLRRAVTISNILDIRTIENARMTQALDAVRHGVLLINDHGTILHANRQAGSMLRDGAPIGVAGGTLKVRSLPADKELKKAIQLAARDETQMGKTGTAIRLTDPNAPPIFARVLPMAGSDLRTRLQPGAAAAIFIEAPPGNSVCVDALADGFALTAAEKRLLANLLTGRTLLESAEDIGIAISTARTHLSSIFRKTGVSRQAELMQLATRIASLP